MLPWIWPGGLLLAADRAVSAFWADAAWLEAASFQFGWFVLGGAALLGWRFGRSRIVAVAGMLALLSFQAPVEFAAEVPGPWQSSCAFVLLTLGALSLVRDRGVFSAFGAVQIVGATLGTWIAAQTAIVSPETWAWLDAASLPGGPEAAGLLPAVLGVALLPALVQAWRHEHPVERSLVWLAILLAIVCASEPGTVEARSHLLVAGTLLLLSGVETSYGLAFMDELTGLPTRRALWQAFETVGSTYTVAMVDVDHFKKFNDKHGHDVGDQVLRMVAGRLGKVKGGGRAFRFGGEEFTVLFPGKGREEALPFLEELRVSIEDARFAVRGFGRPKKKPAQGKSAKKSTAKKAPRQLSVTVSIGYAERTEKANDPESVIKAADKALYRAKKAGRNRVAK